jgi:hypothetical protein
VTAVASRPQVVEIESQVRPLSNGNLMVGVQVAVAPTECCAQFVQHLLRWWVTESDLPEYSDNLGLPAAIDTPPAVALEAQDAKLAVGRVVPALSGRAAAFVVFTLSGAPVELAGPVLHERGAAWMGTGAEDGRRH